MSIGVKSPLENFEAGGIQHLELPEGLSSAWRPYNARCNVERYKKKDDLSPVAQGALEHPVAGCWGHRRSTQASRGPLRLLLACETQPGAHQHSQFAFTPDEISSQHHIYSFLNINLNCSLQIAERKHDASGSGGNDCGERCRRFPVLRPALR